MAYGKFAYPPWHALARTPTRLVRLSGGERFFGDVEIWAKRDDETGCVLSGNKVRKMEFFAADALAQGADYLITSGVTVSNHARTVAAAAHEVGMRCGLILFRKEGVSAEPDGNFLLDLLLGADIRIYDYEARKRTKELLNEFASALRAQGHNPYIVPDGGSSPLGMMGLVKMAEELSGQIHEMRLEPDAVVVAVGSGGTFAGLLAGAKMFGIECPVWGFSISRKLDRLREKLVEELEGAARLYGTPPAAELDVYATDEHVGPSYGIMTSEESDFIRRFTGATGIVVCPTYMGKVFLGVSKEVQGGVFKNARQVIVVHTGGIFGLFPHRTALGLAE
jgi:D-cysteine desulfhydrase